MRSFASFTGFEGTDDEWAKEFSLLLAERGRAHAGGLDFHSFEALVNDRSDSGCFCTDEELQSLLTTLDEAPVQPLQAAQQAPDKEIPATREELIRRVFLACDSGNKGLLIANDMKCFAASTGFDGTEAEWQQEFQLLLRDHDPDGMNGLDLIAFEALVNDPSDRGCYCTDEELRKMLQSWADSAPAATPQVSSPLSTRGELIAAVFKSCNVSGTGILVASEMRRFAGSTGFDGTDSEWTQEFARLLQDWGKAGATGVDLASFEALVNDPSDNRCYCSDEDLKKMLETWSTTTVQKAEAPAASPRALSSREELIRAVFRSCDAEGTGALSARQMRRFAESTGFEGSDADWDEEFSLLLQERGCPKNRGFDLASFEALVNDNSQRGCYASDEELKEMLKKWEQKAPPPAEISVAQVSASTASSGRQAMIRTVFRLCDSDNTGVLTADKMRFFANLTGFEGSDAEWSQEFALLCKDHGQVQSGGLDLQAFEALVNDNSTKGCFCSDEELKAMISRLETKATRLSPEAVQRRREVVKAILRACDANSDGFLSPAELTMVAELASLQTGHWPQAVARLCSGASTQIVNEVLLGQVLQEPPPEGLGCSEEQLKQVLKSSFQLLRSRLQPQEPVPAPAAQQPALPTDREGLKRAAFAACDLDGDGSLDIDEMRLFAVRTGFEGTSAQWEEEFAYFFDGVWQGGSGISYAHFAMLVEEPDNKVEDSEFLQLLPQLQRQHRLAVISLIFCELDRDDKGQLSADDFRFVGNFLGFTGTPAEWADDFLRVCLDHRQDPKVGLSLTAFRALLDTDSASACYCTDEELHQLLREARAARLAGMDGKGSSVRTVKAMRARRCTALESFLQA